MTITEIKLAYNLKKQQNLAKANGFKFDWSSKTWKHKGLEMKETHPLFRYRVENDSKMNYHDAYEKHGFDFAEEGNY